MIHLFGDVWLGKIATLLREFYPEEPITFTDETQDKAFDPAALPEGTTLVLGSGAGAGAGAGKSAIIVPRALIDGLSSLEILATPWWAANTFPNTCPKPNGTGPLP